MKKCVYIKSEEAKSDLKAMSKDEVHIKLEKKHCCI